MLVSTRHFAPLGISALLSNSEHPASHISFFKMFLNTANFLKEKHLKEINRKAGKFWEDVFMFHNNRSDAAVKLKLVFSAPHLSGGGGSFSFLLVEDAAEFHFVSSHRSTYHDSFKHTHTHTQQLSACAVSPQPPPSFWFGMHNRSTFL